MLKVIALSLTTMGLLSACGGGGDNSSSTAASTATFPLQSVYRSMVTSGTNTRYAVSGTCTGTANATSAAATATTFNGAPALQATSTLTFSLSNCTPASYAETVVEYYNASTYAPVAYSSQGEYGQVNGAITLPATVMVGDTAVLGSESLYTSSAKTTTLGRVDISYVVEADGPSSAIVNLVQRSYNTANALTSTTQHRYRIFSDGTFKDVGIDLQAATTSTTHLVLTAQ